MSATPKWVTIVMGAAVAATMLGACSATPAATPSPALTTAAIEMADLAAQQAQSADVKALAERISAAQGPEIETMSGWLSAWGEDPMPADSDMAGMDHSGMDMDGRSQEEVMAELRGLSGADFDRQFLTSMIAHHQGAIEMAQTQLADGRDPQAIELAQKIIADQEAEIEEMQGLLASA